MSLITVTIDGKTFTENYAGEFQELLGEEDKLMDLGDFAKPGFELRRRINAWDRWVSCEGLPFEDGRPILEFFRAAAAGKGLAEIRDRESLKAAWKALAHEYGGDLEANRECWTKALYHALVALEPSGDDWDLLAFVYGPKQAAECRKNAEAEEAKARRELTPPQFKHWQETQEWPETDPAEEGPCDDCPYAAEPARLPGPAKLPETVLRAWREHGELGRCRPGEVKLFLHILQASNMKTRCYQPKGGRKRMARALHTSDATIGRWLQGLVRRRLIVRKSWRHRNKKNQPRMALALWWQLPPKKATEDSLYEKPPAQK